MLYLGTEQILGTKSGIILVRFQIVEIKLGIAAFGNRDLKPNHAFDVVGPWPSVVLTCIVVLVKKSLLPEAVSKIKSEVFPQKKSPSIKAIYLKLFFSRSGRKTFSLTASLILRLATLAIK